MFETFIDYKLTVDVAENLDAAEIFNLNFKISSPSGFQTLSSSSFETASAAGNPEDFFKDFEGECEDGFLPNSDNTQCIACSGFGFIDESGLCFK